MDIRFVRTTCVLASLAAGASLAGAQQADVIRGRITSADGAAIDNAVIVAVSIPNNVTKNAKTDKSGRYAIAFSGGDGDYWITASAIGYTPRRFELKRVADEQSLVADATLTAAATVLDAVKVRAERAKPTRNEMSLDAGGTEKIVGSATPDPNQSGNLAAMAVAAPGVQLIPGADGNPDQFSVFGLGGDQNNTTLNGFGFGGGDIPRDAATRASLGTTLWDVSRGGFSGGQLALRTQSGSNFSSRAMSNLINAPSLEWTDRAGRSSGAEYASVSLGAATAGPIAIDKSFYNFGYQFDRRFSDLQNLTSANDLALATAGVAQDSAARLQNILGRAGVPRTVAGLPSTKMIDRGILLGAFDFSPPSSTSGQSLNVTMSGAFTRANSPFGQLTALPTSDAEATNWFGAVQARHTNYLGFGALTETSVGVTRTRGYTSPYLSLPSGTVRVASTLDDGTSAISQLGFGGSPIQSTTNSGTSVGAQNQLSWFSLDNAHRIKLSSEIRYERFTQDLTANQLGTFSYNSLADLDAGTPASFTRLLSPRLRSERQVVGAVSLGDTYRRTANLQFQYGVRVDGNDFLSSPSRNAELSQVFGADNTAVPNRVYVSSRAGFSWMYGDAPQLAIANGFVRGPRAVVRGGVGVFQNAPATQGVGSAMSTTGLADADRQLTCVGSAVPAPNWGAYLGNPGAIPSQCAGGSTGGVFVSDAPSVVLFEKSYAAPHSVRANLNWSGALPGNRFQATVDGTYSLNLNQPGMTDLNFNPSSRFVLSGEDNRPVYVQPASIVPGTGAIAAQDGRVSQRFARVIEQRSDLESVSRQVLIGIQPVSFSTTFNWSATYVHSNTRDVAPGFTNTAGDPRVRAWGRSALDSRHQIMYGVSYNVLDWFPVSWQGSFRSGRPFTPFVAGDVNGDGFMNDRAFVADPRTTANASLAAGMASLLSTGSGAARDCILRQLGRVAARNSCQAPWSSTSNLTVGINPEKLRLPSRVNVALYVNNALGAADLVLHGENKRRGWGQPITPDQTLLFVRGFDASTRTFSYDVNPRFGATNPSQTLTRNPVVLTAQVRVDLGFTRERQLLTQSLDLGRVRPGMKSSDESIKGMSTLLIPANPMALILAQSDTLGLTRAQADSLTTLNVLYTASLDAIWTPVAKYLAGLPVVYNRAAAYQRYRRAREASVDALAKLAPAIRRLLTPAQMRRLPTLVTTSLDGQYLAFVRSSTAGGANMGVLGMLAQMGWNGVSIDASGAGQTIMVHK